MTNYGSALFAGYTAGGVRAWKGDGQGNRTYFIYDGGAPVMELDGQGNVSAVNTFGPTGLLSRHSATGSTFYTFDAQGSVAQRLDASGNVLSSSAYDAHGNKVLTDSSTDPWGYNAQSGYYTDAETGLILCTHRYYDPTQGRWLNRDPIGYAGGVNLYGYVGNNPTNYGDANGLYGVQFGNGPNIGSGEPTLIFTGDGAAEGAMTGLAADGSSFTFGLWNGGKYRCNPYFGDSRSIADIGRDLLLSAAIPNINIWAQNPLMYEIGQKTLSMVPEAGIGAIERGCQIVKDVGRIKAVLPEGRGWALGIGKTFLTGPTPGGWLGVGAFVQGAAWARGSNNCGHR